MLYVDIPTPREIGKLNMVRSDAARAATFGGIETLLVDIYTLVAGNPNRCAKVIFWTKSLSIEGQCLPALH